MMFERELSGSFRQRGVHLLLATALFIPGTGDRPDCGISHRSVGAGQKDVPADERSLDPQDFARSGDQAAATQTYVPRTTMSRTKSGTPQARCRPRRRVLPKRNSLPTATGICHANRSAGQRRRASSKTYVSKMVGKPLRRFGANLLVPDARDFTAPPTTTVPPDYRLNPGDELLIGLTGSVQASNLRLTISPEGQIFVPRVGRGKRCRHPLRRCSGRHRARRFAPVPQFPSGRVVGRLHGITVYVTGFAATPGSYTVSSLSTLVNAVLAAGGPSAAAASARSRFAGTAS